jgi:hypothetical protein
MTYKQLAELILTDMTREEQECEVVMSTDMDNYVDVVTIAYTDDDCDVLDEGHPVLVPL